VLEVSPVRAAVVTVVADAVAVDAVASAAGDAALRVAPDEAMLIGDASEAGPLERLALDSSARLDPDALVLETSDGWSAWSLRGDAVLEAFARLSRIPPPPSGAEQGEVAGVQGEVAEVPAKVLFREGELLFLVPAMWREHVRDRILSACESLGVRERAEERPWRSPA
jgi:hypothetical protein